MESTATHTIVQALTKAIGAHRLLPGTKLAEQKLATHFGVSRTLVRQALFQLSQNRLIRLEEPARGAFVATPSVDESRQVFAVRRMLETELTSSPSFRAGRMSTQPGFQRPVRQRDRPFPWLPAATHYAPQQRG